MRILHTESSCGWGGQELRILEESLGMVGRGHAVTVAAPAESRLLPEARRHGLIAVELPIARKGLRGIARLRRWLRRNPFDVINTHSSTDSWLVALACALLKQAPPVVRTRHISAAVPANRATRWLYLSATAHIVTTGEALRRQLVEANRFPGDRITSVPTGIDARRFVPGDRSAARRALGLPLEVPLVGIVATLRSWKGHRFLLEALALPGRSDWQLVIVGDGPQRARLEWQMAKLRVEERVRFAGNRADVVPWLHALDVFALPSYANEGVPQALVQAMLCGLPCVTTGVGSIGEAALHEQTALVVAPQDSGELARAIVRLLGQPLLRDQLGRTARTWCAERFGREAMLDAMESIFMQVVASRSGAAAPASAA